MDRLQYLREKRAQVDAAVRNIKDFQLFDFNHVPAEPIERPEMDHIAQAILKYERSHIPTNILAFGSRGCGKTLTLKYLQRLFDETEGDTQLLYVNARENNTSFKMLAHLLGVTPRGVSLSELFNKFRKTYSAPTVIVIDEVDFISEKDRHKEILYLASRCPENYMLVLLANNPRFIHEIDTRTKSSLNLASLHFKNYDAMQIREILKQRAEAGLKKYSNSLLGEISALVTKQTNSDVRISIKTLYYMATEKDPDLHNAFQSAMRDLTADLIRDLNYNNLLVLKAASRSQSGLAKRIYLRYTDLCVSKSEKPFSYSYFYNNLGYLQSLGLILLSSTKVGRAYTNRISLLFEPSQLKDAHESAFK